MTLIRQNVNLKALNTFGIPARAHFYTDLEDLSSFAELIKTPEYQSQKKLIIGGGSNILFTKDFEGLVIRNLLKGISVIQEDDTDVLVKVAAGENWHAFVMWTIEKGFAGIENLSLIPGCVGASPMQNIGAYGVEIKDVFESLEALEMSTGEQKTFTKEECKFGYRESVFKNIYKDRYLITAVIFHLKKNAAVNTSYGAITAELAAMGISEPNIRDVSNAVISIRRSKLPDPAVTGNAGSFFKNPEVETSIYQSIKKNYPEVVAYPLADGKHKLAAGWLIEHCGLKGFEIGGAAVHTKQALVLINTGNADGASVLALSAEIIKRVFEKYGVQLEREVNII